MHRLVMLTVAAVPLVLTSLRMPSPTLTWWTTNALEKVRPNEGPPVDLKKEVSIAAARNEFEPFQIVLRATSQQIDDVDVDISDFRGPDNAIIPKRNFA